MQRGESEDWNICGEDATTSSVPIAPSVAISTSSSGQFAAVDTADKVAAQQNELSTSPQTVIEGEGWMTWGASQLSGLTQAVWDWWQGTVKDPVFNVSLKQSNDTCAKYNELPVYVRLIDHLEKAGLTTEGLLRLSGSDEIGKQMQAQFNEHKPVDLKAYTVHDVSTCLKMFLRGLPEPLFPFSQFYTWIAVQKTEDEVIRRRKIHEMLRTLPPENLAAFKKLMDFLKKVSEKADVNLMSVRNLSAVLTPSLISPPPNEYAQMLKEFGSAQGLIHDLIEHSEYYFGLEAE